jgi:hypothetical protein
MDPKQIEILVWLNKAETSADTLRAQRKQVCSDIDADLRRLQLFRAELRHTLDDSGQLELFDLAAMLSPEIRKLIREPIQ